MGFGVTELLILLVIVALLFGTKKLRNMGGDLGSAVKSFRSAVKESENDGHITGSNESATTSSVIEGEVETEKEKTDKG